MREVKLTAEQNDKLREEHAKIVAIDSTLVALFTEVAMRKGKLDHEFWQTVASLADRSATEDRLKWDQITGVIRVYDKDQEDDWKNHLNRESK